MMKIYFAGSISGGREDAEIYEQLVVKLSRYGEVLTEHIGDTEMGELGEQLPPHVIHDRDLAWLAESDVLVGEVTITSLGVGYEIGKAEEWGKGVLCLRRPGHKPLSPMLTGAAGIIWHEYDSVDELDDILDEFFSGFSRLSEAA